jgi:hypothetical protein
MNLMTRRSLALALVLATALLVPACSKGEGKVDATWPEGTSERAVPKPAEPIRWPLTGLEAPDAEAISARVISVKIENSSTSRPQSGLQDADVVYESIAEGGITRFNCLFQSKLPDPVGPVRSARLSDTTIVPQYGAYLVFSGASGVVNSALRASGLQVLEEDTSDAFFRSSKRARPHNLYAHLELIRQRASARGFALTVTPPKSLAFDTRAVSADTTPTVTEVYIPFSPANKVTWNYDAATNTYLRSNDGKVHEDANTGEQIRTRNVVVIWAKYIAQSKVDVSGSTTYDIELEGTGRMTLFKDGQRYDGTWTATGDAPPVFKAADGTQIKLGPGNTWMQVVGLDVNITMK